MQIKQRQQAGFSLVNMMLATALMALAVGGAMNTYSFLLSRQAGATQDETYNKAVRMGEIVAARISRGGAYAEDRNQKTTLYGGMKICTLNAQLNTCGPYNPAMNRSCLALPTKVGYGALATFEMKGIRLANGQLQQMSSNGLDDQGMKNFDLQGFCIANDWISLHSKNDVVVNSFSLCRFDAQSSNDLQRNYQTNCPTILKNNKNDKTFWMMLIELEKTGIQSDSIMYSRIIPLLNATEVKTL
jgi:type II secretory pathway component PulJ